MGCATLKVKCGYADTYQAKIKPTCGCEVCELKWENANLKKDAERFRFIGDCTRYTESTALIEYEIAVVTGEEPSLDDYRKAVDDAMSTG